MCPGLRSGSCFWLLREWYGVVETFMASQDVCQPQSWEKSPVASIVESGTPQTLAKQSLELPQGTTSPNVPNEESLVQVKRKEE
eukprot:547507-Amphidinium_carterae.1